MKTIFTILLSAFLFTSCTNSPGQKSAAARAGQAALNLAQFAADVAIQVVVSKAVSADDLQNKSGLLYSAANGLRTLTASSGGLVSATTVEKTLRNFTNPEKQHWGDYADRLADAYAKSDAPTDVKLEALAQGAETAAAKADAISLP